MEYKELVDQLKESYRKIFAEQSAAGKLSWAQTKVSNPDELVSPSFPFVGKNYADQKTKILLYASAENLVNRGKYNGRVDNDDIAINRHRVWFDNYSEGRFFPRVHIAPVENGGLPIVLRYICEQLEIETPDTPKEFFESIAIANFGKFSIRTDTKNKDYAKDKSKLDICIPYVEKDLEILQPNIIVMVKSMYTNKTERQEIDKIKGGAKVIPVSQLTPTTITANIHRRFAEKNIEELSPIIRDWYHNLGRYKGNHLTNFLSVFTYLDEDVLKAQK